MRNAKKGVDLMKIISYYKYMKKTIAFSLGFLGIMMCFACVTGNIAYSYKINNGKPYPEETFWYKAHSTEIQYNNRVVDNTNHLGTKTANVKEHGVNRTVFMDIYPSCELEILPMTKIENGIDKMYDLPKYIYKEPYRIILRLYDYHEYVVKVDSIKLIEGNNTIDITDKITTAKIQENKYLYDIDNFQETRIIDLRDYRYYSNQVIIFGFTDLNISYDNTKKFTIICSIDCNGVSTDYIFNCRRKKTTESSPIIKLLFGKIIGALFFK
jgi:hypothetical protein